MRLKNAASIAALRALLARDRKGFAETEASSPAERSLAGQSVILIDRLDGALHEGADIDLLAPRSVEAAEWDGGSETVGGYLVGLLRDEYNSEAGDGWERLAPLSPIVTEVRALSPTS